MQKYKLLNHTADIRVEVWGRTRKELFANAVAAMFDFMLDLSVDAEEIKQLKVKTIKITGNDLEDTLINFLREVLSLFNVKGWLVKDCEPLDLTGRSINARLKVEPYEPQKYPLKMEIKAVTYHGLSISRTNKGWRAKVVFDV